MLPLKKPNPIKGDDLPYNTIALRDCPDGFHFSALIPDASLVHTYEIWSELVGFAEKYYADWEVNGRTLADWLYGLQESYDANKLTFEKMLETLANVKYDHGQRIVTSRSDMLTRNEKRTRSKEESDDNLTSESGSDKRSTSDATMTAQNGVSKDTVLAFDSDNDDPSKKTDTEQYQSGNANGTDAGSYDKDVASHTSRGAMEGEDSNGSSINEITESTDTDRFQGEDSLEYYKRLMENYPNIFMKFVDMFKDDFLIHEVLIW